MKEDLGASLQVLCCVMTALGLANEVKGVEVVAGMKGLCLNGKGVFALEFSCSFREVLSPVLC